MITELSHFSDGDFFFPGLVKKETIETAFIVLFVSQVSQMFYYFIVIVQLSRR